MNKKLKYLLLILALIVSLAACQPIFGGAYFLYLVATSDDSALESEIFEFVIENEAELLAAVEREDFSAFENQGFIHGVSLRDGVAEFSCGGGGVGSGTSYVGFFYTETDDMAAVWCAPSSAALLTRTEGGYEWQEKNGDNTYYVSHICGKFYYYEASF